MQWRTEHRLRAIRHLGLGLVGGLLSLGGLAQQSSDAGPTRQEMREQEALRKQRQARTTQTVYPKPLAFPERPKPYQWHWDEQRHKIWIYKQEAWQQFPCTDCRELRICNGHYIIHDRFKYIVARYDGSIITRDAPYVRCLECFLLVDNDRRMRTILNAESDTVATVINNCVIYTDTIQGEQVFCFPQYQEGLERYNCASLRNWGMMNRGGEWLISPNYDKPFHFVDGRATVWYKGLPQVIDEYGAILEEEPED